MMLAGLLLCVVNLSRAPTPIRGPYVGSMKCVNLIRPIRGIVRLKPLARIRNGLGGASKTLPPTNGAS